MKKIGDIYEVIIMSKIILPTIELKRVGVTEYFAIQSSSLLGSEYSESIYIKVGKNTLHGKFIVEGIPDKGFPLEAGKTVVYNVTDNLIRVVDETTQVVPLTREFKIDMGYFDHDWLDKNRDFMIKEI